MPLTFTRCVSHGSKKREKEREREKREKKEREREVRAEASEKFSTRVFLTSNEKNKNECLA